MSKPNKQNGREKQNYIGQDFMIILSLHKHLGSKKKITAFFFLINTHLFF